MGQLKRQVPKGFDNPTAEAATAGQASEWQAANRDWWEKHPMTYDWDEDAAAVEWTSERYREIDRRFFSVVREMMPWEKIPFDNLIDFESLADKDVLEIGVGNGSHAALLAAHARSFTGIDLTQYASEITAARLKCFGLPGVVRQMDAERLDFPDESFDFVWSWGVIHHSTNTRRILEEIRRVLRPSGKAIIMVYHRNAWNYWIVNGLLQGVLRGELFRGKSVHRIMQEHWDGALARFYTREEWRSLTMDLFTMNDVWVFGDKVELFPLPAGRIKTAMMRMFPNRFARLLTNRLRMGSFLVSDLSPQ